MRFQMYSIFSKETQRLEVVYNRRIWFLSV